MIKCSKCENPAIIRIPYASLNLCREHFIQYFEERVERVINKYKMIEGSKKVAVAVSGGKDSTTLLHLMSKFSDKYGFELIGITIDLGINKGDSKYSSKSVEYAIKNYEMLGVTYRIVNLIDEYGFSIDDAFKKLRRPVCSTCGLAKRYVLNKVAIELGADTLATAHNLNDTAQFVLHGYFGGDVENLARLRAVAPSEKGFVKKIKPLFLSPEKEIATYAILKGIPFITDSCPYVYVRVGSRTQTIIRRKIEELEDEMPGFMMYLVESFENKVRPALEREYGIKEEEKEGHRCKICGMPTPPGRDICSFCAIRLKLSSSPNITQ